MFSVKRHSIFYAVSLFCLSNDQYACQVIANINLLRAFSVDTLRCVNIYPFYHIVQN